MNTMQRVLMVVVVGMALAACKPESNDGVAQSKVTLREDGVGKTQDAQRVDPPPREKRGAGDETEDKVVEVYRTNLGVKDRRSSKGLILRDAAAIIRQDRANYHTFNRRDDGDEGDTLFATKEKRAWLFEAVSKSLSEDLRKRIEKYSFPVEVKVLKDGVKVSEYEGWGSEDVEVRHYDQWVDLEIAYGSSQSSHLEASIRGNVVLEQIILYDSYEYDDVTGTLSYELEVLSSNPIFGPDCKFDWVRDPPRTMESELVLPESCWKHAHEVLPAINQKHPKVCECSHGLAPILIGKYETNLHQESVAKPKLSGVFRCGCLS